MQCPTPAFYVIKVNYENIKEAKKKKKKLHGVLKPSVKVVILEIIK